MLVAVALAVLLGLLMVAALAVGRQHHQGPVSGPGTIEVHVAARAA